MKLNNKITRNIAIVLALGFAISSCQKLEHPGLGDYPKDANPPGGPLKFYATFDGSNDNLPLATVDSIRANFGQATDATITAGAGVGGSGALQFDGSKNGFVSYSAPNDFASFSSFTVSFWINITLAQKDNVNADGVLALADAKNFWGGITFYADHTTGGPSDSMDLKVHFSNGSGDNWDFANYTGAARWPHMYDGQWHQVVFTYDAGTKTGTLYRDGAQFDQKTNETIAFDQPTQLILGGFQEAAGIVSTYGDNTWMSGFPGLMDNVRLYGVALSSSDVAASYANKQ
jgi:hypothetical protein